MIQATRDLIQELKGVVMSPLDTRAHRRFELHIPIQFEFKDNAIRDRFGQGHGKLDGEIYEISQGGMCIITGCFAPKGIIIKIYVKLPVEEGKEAKELTIEGEIRSVVPWKSGNNRFGIKFTDLDEASLTAIRDFIKRNERRSEPRLNIKDMGKKD